MNETKYRSCGKNMIYNFHHALRGLLPALSDPLNGELNADYSVDIENDKPDIEEDEIWYWRWEPEMEPKKVTWILCSE